MFQRRIFFGLFLTSVLLTAGEEKFWTKTDAGSWTPQQISKFTTDSPWAKQVTAVLVSNDSNMATAPRGVGRGRMSRTPSNLPSPDALPKWQALVRWVSAKPMQHALKLQLPETLKGRYVISVTGLPIGDDTAQISDQTTLQLKRGEAIHPESAYKDPNDSATIYFAFLPSMVDISSSKSANFDMVAQPYEVKSRFSLTDMKYRGEPAF